MNEDKFFDSVRASLFDGSLNQGQVDGLNVLLKAGSGLGVQQLAYVLATSAHETAWTIQPIEEYGKGAGRSYGKPDPITGKTYYGRGFVQLTHKFNYERATKELGVDFVYHPERALRMDLAARIIVDGMQSGWFTGKKLSDYINAEGCDYVNARRIVNGTDRARMIAGYARSFEIALRSAGYALASEAPADEDFPLGDPVGRPSSARGAWETIGSLLRAIFTILKG